MAALPDPANKKLKMKLPAGPRAPAGMSTDENGVPQLNNDFDLNEEIEKHAIQVDFMNMVEQPYSSRPFFVHSWLSDVKELVQRYNGTITTPEDAVVLTATFDTMPSAQRFVTRLVQNFHVPNERVAVTQESFNEEDDDPQLQGQTNHDQVSLNDWSVMEDNMPVEPRSQRELKAMSEKIDQGNLDTLASPETKRLADSDKPEPSKGSKAREALRRFMGSASEGKLSEKTAAAWDEGFLRWCVKHELEVVRYLMANRPYEMKQLVRAQKDAKKVVQAAFDGTDDLGIPYRDIVRDAFWERFMHDAVLQNTDVTVIPQQVLHRTLIELGDAGEAQDSLSPNQTQLKTRLEEEFKDRTGTDDPKKEKKAWSPEPPNFSESPHNEDPECAICGKQATGNPELTIESGDKEWPWYFCSEECKNQFESPPHLPSDDLDKAAGVVKGTNSFDDFDTQTQVEEAYPDGEDPDELKLDMDEKQDQKKESAATSIHRALMAALDGSERKPQGPQPTLHFAVAEYAETAEDLPEGLFDGDNFTQAESTLGAMGVTRLMEERPRLLANSHQLVRVAANILLKSLKNIKGMRTTNIQFEGIDTPKVGATGTLLEGSVTWSVRFTSSLHRRQATLSLVMPVIAGEPHAPTEIHTPDGRNLPFNQASVEQALNLKEHAVPGKRNPNIGDISHRE